MWQQRIIGRHFNMLSSGLRRLGGVRQVTNIPKPQLPPVALFQDSNRAPIPFDIKKYQAPKSNKETTIPSVRVDDGQTRVRNKISMLGLFTDASTRGATFKLVVSLLLIQLVVFYVSCKSLLQELADSDTKLLNLWGFYERKDISQTVMAIHIGQLKQQLINAGIKPVTPNQALTVAQHLLSFQREDETGNLLIYVDPTSQIYQHVPFNYEYDIQKIPKLNNVIDETWKEYDSSTDSSAEVTK